MKIIQKEQIDYKMDLRRLPVELIQVIESYVQPWRTYKKEEADNIRWHALSTDCILYDRNIYYNEVQEWTLYGTRWLTTVPEDTLFTRPRGLIQEPTTPREWYQYRFRYLNG